MPRRGSTTARRASPRARERPLLPARSGRGRAVPDRRQHRHQRRRPARLQVRRHRRLGDRRWRRSSRPASSSRVGGALRKDVAGYDLKRPADRLRGHAGDRHRRLAAADPRAGGRAAGRRPLPDADARAAAVQNALASGASRRRSSSSTPARSPPRPALPGRRRAGGAGFAVLAEADGPLAGARADRDTLAEALEDGALAVHAPEPEALWRWRSGVSHAVTAQRGGKLCEDVAVPVERLAEAVAGTVEIGARHGLEACSWGHAGDGNVHATFLLDPGDDGERDARERRGRGALRPRARARRDAVGRARARPAEGRPPRRPARPGDARAAARGQGALDPKGLLNPGAKLRETRAA